MKKRIIAVLLCGMLAASMMTACGKNVTNENPSASAEKENTDILENGLPKDAQSMEHVLEALAESEYKTGNEYAVWDGEYFWNSCAYLVNEDGVANGDGQETEDGIRMPEDSVKEYANALFGAYDGNTGELPDIPENVEGIMLDSSTGEYVFSEADTDAFELEVEKCTDNQDGTYEIGGSLLNASGGKTAADFSASMQATSYKTSGDVHYRYMITTFEITERYDSEIQEQQKPSGNEEETENDTGSTDNNGDAENTENTDSTGNTGTADNNGNTENTGNSSQGSVNSGKQITKDQAMALVEKQFGANGETDPETGNVNTYAYEGITSINGSKYYNFRMSWLVEDHVSYLNNIFVSMDGSQILEGGRSSDGGWEIY